MMNFALTDQQKEIREMVLKFAKNEMRPKAAHYDETGEFPQEIFKKAWELGLMNTCIAAEDGGSGFSAVDSTLITECLSYGCMGMTSSIMANDLALIPITIAGTPAQKKKFLTPFTESYQVASFCLTEPGNGSDAAGIKTTIIDKGDHYLVNGEKIWITNAGYASLFVLYGTMDPALKHKGLCAIIIDSKTPGIEVGKKEDKMGHRASDTRAIKFNNVKVPKENLLGKAGEGWKLAMATLDHSRPLVASLAVGGSQAAMDHAVKYAKERIQFGQPIANFQAIQLMISEMAMKIEAGRLLAQKSAWQLDMNQRNTETASYAKAFAADSLMQIATDAVQIFGSYGYSKEYPVEKIMRDAKLLQIYEGTSQVQRLVIAREVLAK